MSAAVNTQPTKDGRLRAVCEFCGRRSRPVQPWVADRISVWSLSPGWAAAPYPTDYVHDDGSSGDMFACPPCQKALERGAALRSRAYLDVQEVAR